MRRKLATKIMLTLFLTSMLTLAFNIQPAKATGTIYIRADGSVGPPDAPILNVGNVTYTFTDNIYAPIVLERDNIVVDGAGYTVQGTGSENGIDMSMRSNVTIKNVEIRGFKYGIYLCNSSKNNIHGNNIINNNCGIRFEGASNNNAILENNITDNNYGVWAYPNVTENKLVLAIMSDTHVDEDIDTGPGKDYFKNFLRDLDDNILPDYVLALGDLISYNNNTSYDLYLDLRSASNITPFEERWLEIAGDHERRWWDGESDGFEAKLNKPSYYTTTIGNLLIIHCSDMGVNYNRWNASLFNWWKDQVINNQDKIIFCCSHAAVYNTTEGSTNPAWYIDDVYRDQILNVIQNYHIDVWFHGDIHFQQFDDRGHFTNAVVKEWGTNFVNVACLYGRKGRPPYPVNSSKDYWSTWRLLTITEGSKNTKLQMRINGHEFATGGYELLNYFKDDEEYTLHLSKTPSWTSFKPTKFYHNNFINNNQQVYIQTPGHAGDWDDCFPSGGNYWSNYYGEDLYSGPYQNETGSDGIGDTPHIIDANNQDKYPFMKPYVGQRDIGIIGIKTSKTVVGQGCNLNMTITIINYCINTRTFNLTAYANTTIIQKVQDVVLTRRNRITITFVWNTTGFAKGNYTISANATIVSSKTNTINNTLIDGWVVVTLVGDVDGDFDCDRDDVFTYVASNYGKQSGQPGYNPNCDFDGDGDVDADDVFTHLAPNYGKSA